MERVVNCMEPKEAKMEVERFVSTFTLRLDFLPGHVSAARAVILEKSDFDMRALMDCGAHFL